jgi:hypothetical protein
MRRDEAVANYPGQRFTLRNGPAPTLREMRKRIAFYRKKPDDPRQDCLIESPGQGQISEVPGVPSASESRKEEDGRHAENVGVE